MTTTVPHAVVELGGGYKIRITRPSVRGGRFQFLLTHNVPNSTFEVDSFAIGPGEEGRYRILSKVLGRIRTRMRVELLTYEMVFNLRETLSDQAKQLLEANPP